MPKKIDEKTKAQTLSDLITWWLQHKEVELTFSAHPKRRGNLSPEYDAIFWLNGRKIDRKTLAFIIVADLMERGHNYTIAQVYSSLTKNAWAHYIENQPYPDWLKVEGVYAAKRPRGRPRTKPRSISITSPK
jgi:hypothetical protein